IDDVVCAIPVHLFAGIWGTLIVAWTNTDANLITQAIGVAATGVFVTAASLVVFLILGAVGLRPTEEDEFEGLDKAEIGLEAYPEFGSGSQRI
ncbi:MAG: ammonium transporter, partial [Pseudomonadota bacterium]